MENKNSGHNISHNNFENTNVSFGDGAKQTVYTTPQYVQEKSTPSAFPPNTADLSRTGKIQIFLSHSSKDTAFSARLAQDLNTRGYDVWHDIERLNGGDAWWNKIKQELTARSHFIVVLSPDAIVSRWVNDEIAIAWKQRDPAMGKHIIPILYRICEVPVDLDLLQYVSFLPPISYEVALSNLLQSIKM